MVWYSFLMCVLCTENRLWKSDLSESAWIRKSKNEVLAPESGSHSELCALQQISVDSEWLVCLFSHFCLCSFSWRLYKSLQKEGLGSCQWDDGCSPWNLLSVRMHLKCAFLNNVKWWIDFCTLVSIQREKKRTCISYPPSAGGALQPKALWLQLVPDHVSSVWWEETGRSDTERPFFPAAL